MKPSTDELLLAAEWLDVNEGSSQCIDGDLRPEREICRAVAEWLRRQARDREIAKACRSAGITVAQFKRHLAKQPAPKLSETPPRR